MMKAYPCSGCGLCCKMVGAWVEQAKKLVLEGKVSEGSMIHEAAKFPYPMTDTGACSQLDENNNCKIYDTRPDICGVQSTWSKFHQEEISLRKYYKKTAKACNKLILENGLDKKYFVKL